eukprot:CAMPEP_0185040444 /NCGR_PEP_ID=MMETSP1103-20130426/38504_1 /TAXON_ID=36769 /ORGANISM="Paraphysomonas bandaiensis, Strain Caron Lab Isolate" /LENGTH=123 /DNA_ID=CAMNT_0027579745 /DNA_START=105 /DNA_END=476 /DNA_ORIENTATION=+
MPSYEISSSSSNSGSHNISNLEFSTGMLVIAISLLVAAIAMVIIKRSSQRSENDLSDLMDSEYGDEESDDFDSSHDGRLSLSGIRRSPDGGRQTKRLKGAEFIKLQHFERDEDIVRHNRKMTV